MGHVYFFGRNSKNIAYNFHERILRVLDAQRLHLGWGNG